MNDYPYTKNTKLEKRIIDLLTQPGVISLSTMEIVKAINNQWSRRSVSYQLQKLRNDKKVTTTPNFKDMRQKQYSATVNKWVENSETLNVPCVGEQT